MATRKRGRTKKTAGTGVGLGLLLLGVVVYVMRDHWQWLAAAGALIAAIWIGWLIRRGRLASSIKEIDAMSGHEFERYLVRIFRGLGYRARHVGAKGGDFGADLVGERGGVSIAVQAKNYDGGRVGNDAVQQAIAGATYYKCQRAMVVTNSRFTKAAHEQARESEIIPVILWGRDEIEAILAGKRPGGS